jgi:hypothetical protein
VHSLTWDGVEFIDSADHGRQLQSAASFGPAKSMAEPYNPTEAGSRKDGAGPTSTSQLLHAVATKSELQTTTRMAFWLNPGEKSAGELARNTEALSQHLVRKQIRLGSDPKLPHLVDYRVTFTVPVGEKHEKGQFEALTGYMPWKFQLYETFDATTGELKPLDAGPGEQPKPIVFSTADGGHAMGIWAPSKQQDGLGKPRYGRWKFDKERVVKWNCVWRVANPEPGDYAFAMKVLVGTREDVRKTLVELTKD